MEPSRSSPPDGRPATPAAFPDEPGAPDGAAPSAGGPAWPPSPVAAGPSRRLSSLRGRRGAAAGAAAGFLLFLLAFAGTGYRYEPYVPQRAEFSGDVPSDARAQEQLATRLRASERDLRARLAAAAPRDVYIVIDQTQNRLYLRRGDETLLQAVCSTGSGMVLRESTGKKREWVFDSPRGRFTVRSMHKNPVWAKPDWAFVEESQPIPRNPADRLEYNSLGEYALRFGDGFMIHGTLYERLLGRAVSHGCIRVGRDDLRKVWANARVGTQIYIY